jgi:hypothetical protein
MASMKQVAESVVARHNANPKAHSNKFKAGGPTSMDRKKYGKNMARVMNQRGSKRGG